MNIFLFENLPLTLQTIGTLFVAYAALQVHHRVLMEHRIDKRVVATMRFEQYVGWCGVLFVIVGYFLETGIV